MASTRAPLARFELYLQSLEKIRRLPGIRLALPGHEEEIPDLGARIDAIAAHRHERLDRVLEICQSPQSLLEISRTLFGERGGDTRLLALEEAGALVEYLFQRGELSIANLDDVAAQPNSVILYQRPAA